MGKYQLNFQKKKKQDLNAMTQIDDFSTQSLLTQDEIAALLNTENKKKPKLTDILPTDEDCAKKQGLAVADGINRSLLEKYMFFADIAFDGKSNTFADFENLCIAFSDGKKLGYILFSKECAAKLALMAVGNFKKTSAAIKDSPVIKAITEDIAETICFAFFQIVEPNKKFFYLGLSSKPENFSDIWDFSLKSGGKFQLIPLTDIPDKKEFAENKKQEENNRHLIKTAQNTPVELLALVAERKIPLFCLSGWKIGSFVPLGIEKNSEISILCNKKTIYKGVMGRKGQHIAVKTTQKVNIK